MHKMTLERKYWDLRDKKRREDTAFGSQSMMRKKKIPLVGSDMSVGPRRAMDDNLVLLLLLNIFCIKSPTPPLGPLSLRKYTKYFE